MNINEYEHNSFILYKDSRIFISRLSKCQRGELLLAIFDYVCDGLVPDFEDDTMLQMCFDIIRSYLDRDEKKYQDKCRKNKENGRKGGMAKASNAKQSLANGKSGLANLADKDTDKDTDTDSDTDTVSDTDTEKEQADAVSDSADRTASSAAAETAEPPSGDLFSVRQLIATAKRNKVKLTTEGVEVFHEEMQESGWELYGRPVEKKGIVKALRAWAKYHPEYAPEEGAKPEPEPQKEVKEAKPQPTNGGSWVSMLAKVEKYVPEEKQGEQYWIAKNAPKYCPVDAFTLKEMKILQGCFENAGLEWKALQDAIQKGGEE